MLAPISQHPSISERVDPKKGDPSAMSGARSSPIADWVVRQASTLLGGVRAVVSPRTTAGPPPAPPSAAAPGTSLVPYQPGPGGAPWPSPAGYPARREPFFGPGTAPTPMAPKGDVAGRQFDYQSGYNMGSKPRQYSGVSFDQLRGLAESLDMVRLCIETRKDQMERLTWSILPKQTSGQAVRKSAADDRCRKVEQFLQRPDRKHPWGSWLRMLLEDQLVLDAPTLYVRRTVGGEPWALEVVDGALIKPLLAADGRAPDAPLPAYQQVLKGMPAVDYTVDELIYAPRNPRSNHAYGLGPVEQLTMTVNIAVRREIAKLQYFTEGNTPEAIISCPDQWQPEQIRQFQTYWDALMAQAANRARTKFVPGKMGYQPLRSDAMLSGPFDEWLARVICFAFSLPPTAFVQQNNRATAEQANDTAIEEGLAPMMVWFKALMDRIVQDVFGYADLEFTWDDVKQIDTLRERQEDRADVAAGIRSIDEVRSKQGLDPLGIGNTISGGPNGLIFVADLVEAHRSGLTKIQPPPAPPAMGPDGMPLPPGAPPPGMAGPTGEMDDPGPPGLPGPAVPPAPALPAPGNNMAGGGMPMPRPRQAPPAAGPDPLAGLPPGILAAVGLGPQGAGGRTVDVMRHEEVQTDPEMASVSHPQSLQLLRQLEAKHLPMNKRALPGRQQRNRA